MHQAPGEGATTPTVHRPLGTLVRTGVTLALLVALAGCTAPTPPGDPADPTSPTVEPTVPPPPPPPVVVHPVLTLPSAPAAVLPESGPVVRAANAARTFFASTPVVVVAPADDLTAQLEAAAVAVAAGVPLLLAVTPGSRDTVPAEPAAAIADLGAEVVLAVGRVDRTTVGHDLTPVTDAAAQVGAEVAVPTPVEGEELAAVIALERPTVGPRAGLLGEELFGEAAPLPGALALTTGEPVELAAVATARAAGVPVLPAPGELRARGAADAVAAITSAAPYRTIGLGPAFGTGDVLAGRVAQATGGHELPGGGQLVFDDTVYVALYGSPGIPALGVLGEQGLEATIDRARAHAEPYQAMTDHLVVPSFEIIASIASAAPGEDGSYSWKLEPESLRPWIEAAQEAGVYVVLDLQPGRQDFLTQAKHYESLLLYPNVGLALDPEWRLKPDQMHLVQIGSVGIDEVNAVGEYLATLTRENGLPQKMFVLHQFMLRMIADRERLERHDELATVIHVDGQGGQGAKQGTWRAVREGAPEWVHWGWKNFYDEDVPMLDPAGTFAVDPRPDLITYQ